MKASKEEIESGTRCGCSFDEVDNPLRVCNRHKEPIVLLERFLNLSTNAAGEPDYEDLWNDVDVFLKDWKERL